MTEMMEDLIKLADKHVPEELAEDALYRCPVSSPESFINGYIEGFREGYGLGFQDSEDYDKR